MSRMDTRQTVAIDDLSPLRKLSAVRRRGVVHEIRSAGYSIDALLRSAEVLAVHRDGRRLSIEFRVSLLGADPDHPAAIGAVIRDVTERWEQDRRLRARLAELENTQRG